MPMFSSFLVPPPSAAASQRGGCPYAPWLPPLSALLVGLLLACLLLQVSDRALLLETTAQGLDLAASEVRQGTVSDAPILARLFTPEIHHWGRDIQTWAAQMNLDPNLVATVMQIESCGDPRARSSAGAMGLFQVMPYHFELGEDPYDPNTNAHRGLLYLQRAWQASKGDLRLTLAAYNGGIGLIEQEEAHWPAETRRYVYWGSGIYADARRGLSASPRLQEWLQAGGASLCSQARQRLGVEE